MLELEEEKIFLSRPPAISIRKDFPVILSFSIRLSTLKILLNFLDTFWPTYSSFESLNTKPVALQSKLKRPLSGRLKKSDYSIRPLSTVPYFLFYFIILWASIFIWPDREGHLLFVTEAGSHIREDLVRPEKQFYNKNKTLQKHFNVGGTSLCSWQSTFIQTMGLTRISAELCR